MAEMHSYATNSRHQAPILGTIAFLSALASIGMYYVYRWLTAEAKPNIDIEAYGWLIGPLTLTGCYSLLLALYERYLWRFFSQIPNVGGTWVGCTHPNYQTWPHLSVLKIEQSWSTVFVEMSHFWKGQENDEWSASKRLGRDQSLTATLSGKRVNEANFTFSYQHKGVMTSQADFDGTMDLIVDLPSKRMQGKYYTNRPSLQDGTVCSYGYVILFRQSRKLLSAEEAFNAFIGNSEQLSRMVTAVVELGGRKFDSRAGSPKETAAQPIIPPDAAR